MFIRESAPGALPMERMATQIRSEPPTKTLGDGVFSYWFRQAGDHPLSSAWVLLFYETVQFTGLTLPKSVLLPGVARFQYPPTFSSDLVLRP